MPDFRTNSTDGGLKKDGGSGGRRSNTRFRDSPHSSPYSDELEQFEQFAFINVPQTVKSPFFKQ